MGLFFHRLYHWFLSVHEGGVKESAFIQMKNKKKRIWIRLSKWFTYIQRKFLFFLLGKLPFRNQAMSVLYIKKSIYVTERIKKKMFWSQNQSEHFYIPLLYFQYNIIKMILKIFIEFCCWNFIFYSTRKQSLINISLEIDWNHLIAKKILWNEQKKS